MRISVALDNTQPFFFLCSQCGTPTKGTQFVQYKPHPESRVELEAGRILNVTDLVPDQVLNIHPELPSLPTAATMMEPGGSPFIMHVNWLGEGITELLGRIRNFRELAIANWSSLKRLGHFYTERRWKLFDIEGERLFEEQWKPLTSDVARHDFYNRLLQAVFMPFVVSRQFVDAVTEFGAIMNSGRTNSSALFAYCNEQMQSGIVPLLQADVLRRFDFIVEHSSLFTSALPVQFYPPSMDEAAKSLRLFRDEWDLMKVHYVDSYELAHKVLALTVGLLNCIERGCPDTFDSLVLTSLARDGKKNFADLRSLASLGKLPNAPKVAFLRGMPVLQSMWKEAFVPKLRNAMGHNDARHNLRSGMVTIGGVDEMSYLKVADTVCRTIPALLMLAHMLKMLCIVDAIYQSREPPSP